MAFRQHVFFCINQREAGRRCCNQHGATEMQQYLKQRIAALGLAGDTGIRVNQAGCMGHCKQGPVLVVYPQGRWYRYENQADIDEILHEELQAGRPVPRLLIDSLPEA